MTQNEAKFTHITVSSDDDDVVIQAGVRPEADAAGAAGSREGEGAQEVGAAPEAAPAGEGSKRGGATASRDARPEAAPAPKRGGAHETTLEDIEGSKMSSMQKAIIAVCLVAIVAAVVYYFAFMR